MLLIQSDIQLWNVRSADYCSNQNHMTMVHEICEVVAVVHWNSRHVSHRRLRMIAMHVVHNAKGTATKHCVAAGQTCDKSVLGQIFRHVTTACIMMYHCISQQLTGRMSVHLARHLSNCFIGALLCTDFDFADALTVIKQQGCQVAKARRALLHCHAYVVTAAHRQVHA